MRKYLVSAAILTLLAAPSAWSDPPADRGNRGNEGHARAEPNRQGPPQARQFDRGNRGPQMSQARPDRGDQDHERPQMSAPRGDQNAERGNRGQQMFAPNRGDQNPGDRRPAPQASIQAPPNRGDQNLGRNRGPVPQASVQPPQNRSDRRSFNDNRNASSDFNRDGRTDFRPGRGAAPRHDFSGFRDFHRNFQASRRFQAPTYRRPAGWYSHRWAFGEFLPAAFWMRDYWLIDFADYDLPPPPFGAVWVRVDHDALLIDEDTGEIITVAYDVFY
jgi:Ni/Co efflux regulator RcnB